MIDRETCWRKSTFSGTETECVEVPNTLDAVRDSKHSTAVLSVPAGAFRNVITAVKLDQFTD